MDELQALNALCKNLYESTEPSVRQQAEQNLAELSESPECIRRCMLLLSQGEYPYGPLVASTTLMKVLSAKTNVSPDQKLELTAFVIDLLGRGAPSFPPFLVTSLSQLFSRLTKQEWTYTPSPSSPDSGNETSYPFRDPVKWLIRSIDNKNTAESILAVQILTVLVTDMNSSAGMDSVNKHRKSLAQFRDSFLYDIFSLTINFVKEIGEETPTGLELTLTNNVIDLCLSCLVFDYIGSLADETSDDNCNVQIPTTWRESFTDGKVVDLFFKMYHNLPTESSEKKLVLSILAQLASVRRTLFNGSERQSYVQKLVEGVVSVIQNPAKLTNQKAFHEFCRLVARLKTNYQLCELINVPCYAQMLRLLAEFTVESLRMMDFLFEFSANSTYFLLTFWQRMVTSVPYVRNNDDHLLNVYCPEITAAFIESRLQHVEKVVRESAEDPLEDQGSTLQLMEHLATICRCEYEKTCQLLARHFDENAKIWTSGSPSDLSVRIAEGRLVWLITLIGTAVFGKTSGSGNDAHDKMDGDMIARCITAMRYNDNRLQYPQSPGRNPGNGNLRLEVSFIHMLEQFRRAYIMDQITRTSSVYDKLQSQCGISEETDMLGVIIQKILTNLKYWPTQADILDLSLSLLKDLSLGYSAVRKLFRLPEVQLLLNNHTVEHFVFLGPTIDYTTMKQRTVFYEALMRLLTTDLSDDDEVFVSFIRPLSETVKAICDTISTNSPAVEEEQLKRIIVGLCRDIRGIAVAATTKSIFQVLFDWMYPDVFNILLFSVGKWSNSSDVTTPVMRLLSELAQNRQQRLKFEMSSCSAVLLFREISKIICVYGNNLLSLPDVPKECMYKERYKNIGVVFLVLKSALIGSYVPFGVFRLYGDTCLQDVLGMFVKFFMLIPEAELQNYTKIAQNYYNLLEHVTQDNMPFLTNLSVDVVCAILRSIHNGITSLDAVVITSSCSTLDTILNYMYRRLTRPNTPMPKAGVEPEGESLLLAVKAHPEITADILQTMMSMLMFGEVKCQWSLSRPLLGLILVQEDVFTNLKTELTAQHPFERQQQFELAFSQLMTGVDRSLSVKNKDIFTQNLSKFRRDVFDVMKGKRVTLSTVSPMATSAASAIGSGTSSAGQEMAEV
ncbi:unnamed protein product [Caenorhabditis auriculariae]|uniref:Exportin-7/Ran-binding protein 17 TPR repeats domain-containing protein n=1 Tax=Caenorhabditis auriculariae TaxID=2777116 RepID=A0A8S1HKV5_9PELO|nr:unnamed protein product [Caenorhabditis auriculariae]